MKVLGKCQLREAVQEKEEGLDASGTRSSLNILTFELFYFLIIDDDW